jgi:hypothetical protein
VASCNQVFVKTGLTYAAYIDTSIYGKFYLLSMNCSPANHRGTRMTNRCLIKAYAPGAMDGSPRSLQSDEMPPDSNLERNRGLNPIHSLTR